MSKSLFTGVSFLAVAIGGAAYAQTAPSTVGEVVVTAQRRTENLQNVPISVTAFSQTQLQANDIRDLNRLEVLTPGFTFGQSGSDGRPAIRGVRTENVAVSGDPTIGFYVDGVYQTRASQSLQPFVDVQRVEIERGPQGTLFGRNTFGGAISVVTASPSKEFGAAADATFGQYNRIAVDGDVNIPINDKAQVRFAGLRETMDGYVKGIDSAHDIYNRDTSYYRVALKLEPIDKLDVTLRYSYWTEKGTGAGAFGYKVGGLFVNPTTGANDLLHGIPVAVDPKQLGGTGDIFVAGVDKGFPIVGGKLFYDGDVLLKQDLHQDAFNAQINYDLGPVQLHSITSYEDFRVFRNGDNDFSPRVFNIDTQDDALNTVTEELQLGSKTGQRLEWLVGYYFLREDITRSIFASFPELNQNGTASNGWPTTTSNAGYAQASYFLIPTKLRLTAGVRYTEDDKNVKRYISTFVNGRQTTAYSGQELDFKFTKTTWRADADYFVTSQNMIYANVSTGFRSGGFNSGAFSNPNVPGAFRPETVTAYEAGSKNRFLDGRLQLDVAIYRNEFRNLQVQNQFLIPASGGGFTTSSAILNAASAHAQGLEAELIALPIDRLSVILSATATDTRYDSYANVPAPSLYTGTYNLTGHRIPYTPNYKVTGQVYYDFALTGHGTLRPEITVDFSGDYYNTDFNTVLDHQPAFIKTDLRLTWTSESRKYSVSAFVNNVGDAITLNRATFGSGGLNESYDAPRMWGVKLSGKY